MTLSMITLGAAFFIRIVALYLVILKEGYWNFNRKFLLLFLAAFSTFLALIMPATGFDVIGIIFRVALFAVILMTLLGINYFECIWMVVEAAIIETIIVLALMITPLAFVVNGLSLLVIP